MVNTRSASKKVTKTVTKKRGNAKKQNKKKSKKKNQFHCDQCSRSYCKASNLKQHKEVKHSGKAWVCPFCHRNQASKHSHQRHLKRCPNAKNKETHPDSNSFYLKSRKEYTAKSASNLIERLQKVRVAQHKAIVDLKERLLRSLKRNIALKKILRVNHADEVHELEFVQSLLETDDVREENSNV